MISKNSLVSKSLKNRYKFVILSAMSLAIVTHAYFIILFYSFGIFEMTVYNILSTFFFILMLFAAKNSKILSKHLLLFGSIEVVLHSSLGTYYVGYEGYLMLFCLLLPLIFMFSGNWKNKVIFAYILSIILAIICAYFYFNDKAPIYNLAKESLIILQNSVFLFITLIILGVTFYFNKVVNENEYILKRANKELASQNEEKKAMLHEIHHRVKNNLHFVNSLLRMQSSEIDDPKVITMMDDMQQRILTMGAIHEQMYSADNLQRIKASDHLDSLVREIVSTYAVGNTIKLDIKCDSLHLEIEKLIPLGLIVNEIIINSLKYGIVGVQSPKITMHLTHVASDSFQLLLGDNGVGFSDADTNNGLGTKLITIFARQLKGDISHLEQAGTYYMLKFNR